MKLLYILEESFVKQYNIPFLGLEFEVWQAGPVARDIFIDLSDNPVLLEEYIVAEKDSDSTYIKAIKDFSDDEFSDNEIEMMEYIAANLGQYSAKELVKYTHRKGSNWYEIASSTGLLEKFAKKLANSSEEKIDFTRSLDPKGKETYYDQVSFNKLVQFVNE